jgi:hypothetical protein
MMRERWVPTRQLKHDLGRLDCTAAVLSGGRLRPENRKALLAKERRRAPDCWIVDGMGSSSSEGIGVGAGSIQQGGNCRDSYEAKHKVNGPSLNQHSKVLGVLSDSM